MNNKALSFLAYYVTSAVLGLAMTIAGVYAFVVVYGIVTLFGAVLLGIVLQLWYWFGIMRWNEEPDQTSLTNAVERARKED